MDLEDYRTFCLRLKGTTEEMPFDDKALVFKVMGKMFALTNIESFEYINLKCDPEIAIELREKYDNIKPGFHMNKKHWNTIYNPLFMNSSFIKQLTMDSYQLVIAKMSKKDQENLKLL